MQRPHWTAGRVKKHFDGCFLLPLLLLLLNSVRACWTAGGPQLDHLDPGTSALEAFTASNTLAIELAAVA